jgi:hypothetical protein
VCPDKRGEIFERDANRVHHAHMREHAGVAERVHGRRADAETARRLANGQEFSGGTPRLRCRIATGPL